MLGSDLRGWSLPGTARGPVALEALPQKRLKGLADTPVTPLNQAREEWELGLKARLLNSDCLCLSCGFHQFCDLGCQRIALNLRKTEKTRHSWATFQFIIAVIVVTTVMWLFLSPGMDLR